MSKQLIRSKLFLWIGYLLILVVFGCWIYVPLTLTVLTISYVDGHPLEKPAGSVAFILGLFILGFIHTHLTRYAEIMFDKSRDSKKIG